MEIFEKIQEIPTRNCSVPQWCIHAELKRLIEITKWVNFSFVCVHSQMNCHFMVTRSAVILIQMPCSVLPT